MHQIDVFLRLFWYCAAATNSLPETGVGTAVGVSASEAPPAASARAWSEADSHRSLERLFGQESVAPASASAATGIPHHPSLSAPFYIGLGTGLYTSTTEARLDSSAGIGTTLNFENVLGLDESSWAPQLLGRWRFSERWRLEFEYFEVKRSSSKAISGEIEWGGEIYPIDTVIDAKFNTSVTRLSCGYSFFKTDDKEFGVALGLHLTDFNIDVAAEGATGNGGAVLAPLPVVSTYGQVALTDAWAVAMRLDAFKLEYAPYRGHIFSMGVDVMYQPWEHFGFGLGWRSLDIGVGASNSDWDGQIRTHYQGPILFATGTF